MNGSLIRFLGRVLRAIIVLALLGVLANDVVRAGVAASQLAGALNDAINASIDAVSDGAPQRTAEHSAALAAEARGCNLVAYEQTAGGSGVTRHVRIHLSVSTEIGGMVVAPAIKGLVGGTPAAEWYADGDITIHFGQTKQVDLYGAGAP